MGHRNSPPKILIIPPLPWYMEAHYEYLIRYLSDEFFIEIGEVPYEPYDNFIDRYPETRPFMRNPNDYDLIVPMLATHWHIDQDRYKGKAAVVMYEPGEGRHQDVAVVGCTTPVVEKGCTVPYHSLRFGVDTELFKPYPMVREDDLLHVGVVGTHINPRRMIKEAMVPNFDLEGVRFMFYPSTWVNNGGDLDKVGGKEFLKRVVSGEKYWPGVPNVYNSMDVLLRIDCSYGYSFPTIEAAACGVPSITTNQGIDHYITEAGGGIMLRPDYGGPDWVSKGDELKDEVRKALIYLRDNPKKRKTMGKKARKEVENNWTWDKFIPAWRKFFREGLRNAT